MEANNLKPSSYIFFRKHLRQDVLDTMGKLWGIYKPLTHNPSPNPVSLTLNDLKRITEHEYVVAKKTDGIRYNLVLGKHVESGRPFAAMVDRALCVYQIEIFAPKIYFEGSLFDGELVWNKHQHCFNYFVFDVISVAKDEIGKKTLLTRYEVINKLFMQEGDWDKTKLTDKPLEVAKRLSGGNKIISVPDANNMLFLYSKPCVKVEALASLHRSSTNHDNDGYIFTPVNAPVYKNRHTSLFKWKFQPTIDVRYIRDGMKFSLSCMHEKSEFLLHERIPDWNFIFDEKEQASIPESSNMILELNLKINEQKKEIDCHVHRVRNDKNTPNDYRTIKGIIDEICNSVSLEQLLALGTRKRKITD